MLTTIWALSMLWYFCKGNIKDHWPHITIANITKMKRVQNIAKRDTKTGSEQMLLGKRCSTQGCCQLSTCKKKKYTVSAKCNRMKHTWITLSVLKMRKLRLRDPNRPSCPSLRGGIQTWLCSLSPLSLLSSLLSFFLLLSSFLQYILKVCDLPEFNLVI